MKKYPKSKFAEGLGEESGIVQLMDDLGEALTLGRERLIMMGGGNPAHIPEVQQRWRQRMQELLDDESGEFDRILADYDQPAGSPAFRETMAQFLAQQFGWKIGPENVAVTNGGQTAFFFLLNRFAGPMADGSKRKILLPLLPEYIGYGDQAAGAPFFDARLPKFELIGDREFKYHIDFENLDLDPAVHGAVVVSRPTNPSSNVLTDREVSRLSALSADCQLPLIIDNAYGLPFPGVIFKDAKPLWDEHIVLTMSLSKLGLPGTRTGIVIGNPSIVRDVSAMTGIVGLANNNLGQAIVRPMLESGEILELVAQRIRPFYEQRAAVVEEMIRRELPGSVPWRMHLREGAFFVWFWFEGLPISSRELYGRLRDRGLIVVPGEYFFFGLQEKDGNWPHRHECIRVSIAQPEEVLEKGFQILGETLRELY